MRATPVSWADLPASGSPLRSWVLQEPPVEGYEHQDDPDVDQQPWPELVPEEEDVHAHDHAHHGEHVKHDGDVSSHPFVVHDHPPSRATRFLVPQEPGDYPPGL